MRLRQKKVLTTTALLLLLATKAYCWNSLGHRLVAQIAYHHLTPHAKDVYNHYNHALDKFYRPQSFVNSAAWLDHLYYQRERWLGKWHYIDLPFSLDGTQLRTENKANAVSAIEKAGKLIQDSRQSDFEKGFSLRVLLHVVADLHQPMHAVSLYSKRFPKGDLGGNLFPLGANPVARNLHAYWDKGGGLLSTKQRYAKGSLEKKASGIEKRYPCQLQAMKLDPDVWARESHQLAISKAYKLKSGQKPDKAYQQMVRTISEQRLALAGCRLAALLNRLA